MRQIILKVALPVACGVAALVFGVVATGHDAAPARADQASTVTALDLIWA
ncbi:hypothetical protein [Streptomyces sp. TLI_171]|nr:hypothetical protein [Streptomyces sp. TLI_171]